MEHLQPGLYVGGLMTLVSIYYVVVYYFFKSNSYRMTKEQIEEDKRLCELIVAAMQRYPTYTALNALIRYSADIERRISTLRNNTPSSDVCFILKNELRNRTLLLQEIAYWTRTEVENKSGFNVVTSAQA